MLLTFSSALKFTTNLDNLKIIFSLEGSWKFDTGTKNE